MISARVAPPCAANVAPDPRRSWNRNPSGSPFTVFAAGFQIVVQWSRRTGPSRQGEQPCVVLGADEPFEMGVKLGNDRGRDGDDPPARGGLGRADDHRATVGPLHLLGDRDPVVEEINASASKAHDLAEAQTPERAEEHHAPVLLGYRIREGPHLRDGRDGPFGTVDRVRFRELARVPSDHLPRHGGFEDQFSRVGRPIWRWLGTWRGARRASPAPTRP
jgi:hypothetical protein